MAVLVIWNQMNLLFPRDVPKSSKDMERANAHRSDMVI